VHIGKEIAYSDSSGHFQVRVSKHGPYALVVTPDEFLTNVSFEVVTAPAQARAESDESAQNLEIVVRQKIFTKQQVQAH
jgi:hypothetical protein